MYCLNSGGIIFHNDRFFSFFSLCMRSLQTCDVGGFMLDFCLDGSGIVSNGSLLCCIKLTNMNFFVINVNVCCVPVIFFTYCWLIEVFFSLDCNSWVSQENLIWRGLCFDACTIVRFSSLPGVSNMPSTWYLLEIETCALNLPLTLFVTPMYLIVSSFSAELDLFLDFFLDLFLESSLDSVFVFLFGIVLLLLLLFSCVGDCSNPLCVCSCPRFCPLHPLVLLPLSTL